MALEADKYLIGIVVFTLFVTTGVLFLHDLDSSYPEIDLSTDNFDGNLNMTGEMYNLSQEIGESTFGKDIDETDTPSSMFAGAFSALRLLTSSYRLVGNVLDSFARVIPVPPAYKTLALSVLTILIVFSVIYLIFRFQPRK